MVTEYLNATSEVTVRPTRSTNAFKRSGELMDGLKNATMDFPVPEITALYDAGDRLAAEGESCEPLFEAEFERDVLDAACAEIAPDVGRLLTEAINRRLPWSTKQKGWRVHR